MLDRIILSHDIDVSNYVQFRASPIENSKGQQFSNMVSRLRQGTYCRTLNGTMSPPSARKRTD
ncbi:hypothetical protein C8Q75DRAFT_779751 [Abortiporus biennis]|nr:hypothetical protein C8Q75DRAFT_779751 [Abortiporus biennis]